MTYGGIEPHCEMALPFVIEAAGLNKHTKC